MDIQTLAPLAWKHTRNLLSEAIYLRTGYDTTRPVTFYGEVNERCNLKCRYCTTWRSKERTGEMTIEEWQAALRSIREFVGRFSINFSGGEVFLTPGFVDLLAWCNRSGIAAGVTTNGTALKQPTIRKLVAARPLNVNISVDSPDREVHDYLRGCPGLFARLSAGLKCLVEERALQGGTFPIIIKPAVTTLNFRQMPALVEWAKAMGATCVYPQPLVRSTPETWGELWIKEPEMAEFEAVVRRLIEMKRAGEPILTPEPVLALMLDHFRMKRAPLSAMPCRVGLRNFLIHANGDVSLCITGFPRIGNLKAQTAREIWYSAKAREVRKRTVQCGLLCLGTCVSPKTLRDKVKMGLIMLRSTPSAGKANPDCPQLQPTRE